MAGDDARKLSLQGLSARRDSMDERCGKMEASLQSLQHAIEGFTLQLKNKNKPVDGLHQGRLGFERSIPTNNRNNLADGLYQGGPGIGRHPHPHPSSYNSPPSHPPPYQPRHRNQIPFLEESEDEELGFGVHHEQPWHEGFSRKGEEGRFYGKDRGHGYNPDRHRQQRYSYHPSTPHQQPHHRHQQFDYYDDYSPPRRVHHPPSSQPQPQQQQRYKSSLLPQVSIKSREPEKRKGGEKSEENFVATIGGNPLKIDEQGMASSKDTLSLREISMELSSREKKAGINPNLSINVSMMIDEKKEESLGSNTSKGNESAQEMKFDYDCKASEYLVPGAADCGSRNLSCSSLKGSLAPEFGYLSSPQELILDNNLLLRPIPMFASHSIGIGLCQSPRLDVGDFSYNFFVGKIPPCLMYFSRSSFQGNCFQDKHSILQRFSQICASVNQHDMLNTMTNKGHVHAYERSECISNIAYNIVNGESMPVPDQSAPVYIIIGEDHSKQVRHAPSLPSSVHLLSRLIVPFQRRKLDLAIYTFGDYEELTEPHLGQGRNCDEDSKSTSARCNFILDLNSRSSSFEEGGTTDVGDQEAKVQESIRRKHEIVCFYLSTRTLYAFQGGERSKSRSWDHSCPQAEFATSTRGTTLRGYIFLGISFSHGVFSIDHGQVLFDPGGICMRNLKISLSCQRRVGEQRLWDHTFPQAEFVKDGSNSRRVRFEEGWTDAGAKSLGEEVRQSRVSRVKRIVRIGRISSQQTNSSETAHAHKVEERNLQCRHISHSLFSIDQNPCLRPCHLKVWLGDLNYRIQGISNLPVRSLIRRNLHSVLTSNDQLLQEAERGQVFNGYCEGTLSFKPTYKYNVGSSDYDTSHKMRVPSWTDRILFKTERDNIEAVLHAYESIDDINSSGRPLSGRPEDPLVDQTEGLRTEAFAGYYLVDQRVFWSTRPRQ